MVRLLLILTLFMGTHTRAQDLYLSPSQKSVLSLALQTAMLAQSDVDPEEARYLLKNLVARYKLLAEKELRTKQVDSYEEFIRQQKSDNLFGQNKLAQLEVDRLLELMPDPLYIGTTEKVQRKINLYYQQKKILSQQIATSALAVSAGLVHLIDESSSEKLDLNAISTFFKNKIDDYVSEFAGRMTKGSNSQYVSILARLLKSYYELLPMSQKAEILYQVMQLPLQTKPTDIFLTMIQNSGPQMQKLVQIIGRNPAIPPEFRAIFQKLESQVQPVPWTQVKKIVSAEVDLNEFSYFEHAALGVGTMAQTHRVQRKGMPANERTFVIRFLKPDIEKLLEMDHTILIRIAEELDTDPEFKKFKLPSLRKQVEDIHQSVVEELQLEKTVQNQRQGKRIYETQIPISFSGQKNILEVHVPATEIIGKNKKLMQQEIIFGRKVPNEMADYAAVYPELYPIVAQKITEHWLEQAFFKTGFFHADLHQGNILMKVTDDKVQVNLLDFGMVGTLNEQQRDSVLLLALGLKLNNADLIADSFSNLTRAPMDSMQKGIFHAQVLERVTHIVNGDESHASIEEWAAWAVAKGLDLHYEFIKLNRGIMAISSLLEESKSPLTFEEIGLNVVFRNKAKVMKLLAKQDFIKYSDLFMFALDAVKTKNIQPTTAKIEEAAEPVATTSTRVQCQSLF